MTTSIHSILEEFREAATSNRDLGDKFEKLFATYLVTDPLYQDKFSDVWLWNEWPDRGNKPDVGIDLVAKERYTGGYCAIQCKFYDPAHTLQKADIDSFFTASGKAPFTSRIIISTTDKWGKHAEEALENQHVPVSRLRVQDLADSPIDWSVFSLRKPTEIKLKTKKKLRDHQKKALKKTEDGFKENDRGKLIMACGTGKTFTALKITEKLVPKGGTALFLVPSISLLSQTLREWTAETEVGMQSFAVCSDSKVGKKNENEDISTHDLAFPATTDVQKLANQVLAFAGKRDLTVIFSTYQSIEVVAQAQKKGLPEFDLIICDEAHRTTGVTLEGDSESHFVKVHDQSFIKGKKRLYMTATPRIYSDSAVVQAQENDAEIISMNNEAHFGPEFHRLGFGEAVGAGLLADYKVMVLAVDEKYVSKTFQSQIADENNEISLEDAVKITGCWNGLSKRIAKVEGSTETDSEPMRRAVAFSRSIKDSKRLTSLFSQIVDEYRETHEDEDGLLACQVDHVDGTFNALKRNALLDWLKEDTTSQGNVCRILSNARCLSEGVDVPALDAVMFLNPRNSVVDVVQSVGRVMRTAPGKKYGYIILPIGIPSDMSPEEALKDNQKYKVVWQVLQALRAHDDRFNATVNQIELNKKRPEQIQVIGVGGGEGSEEGTAKREAGLTSHQFAFDFPHIEEWRDAIYAKIVLKCGDRRYWEQWATDIAEIAERHITRIKALLDGANKSHKKAFADFLSGLRDNLNPQISQDDAIEMLAQHLITKPVFDALFEGYAFTEKNPVSVAMQQMLDVLQEQAIGKEVETLEKFYTSVRTRVKGIDNAKARQEVIRELYEKFFKTAFKAMADRLGIVYTPVQIVDFIIHSADLALRNEFGVGLSDKGVHVIDPFTGTGTFMVRLLQSGLIKPKDLAYKYKNELHANEIVLLAYYIAAINIEEAFHGLTDGQYVPFEGIVLTDTFQMMEGKGTLNEVMFPENNKRAARQNKTDIRVVIGNPPYSVGQDSHKDDEANIDYPALDARIAATYVAKSKATLKRNTYDSYTRAFRWASDRIKDKGIVCFVSNGSLVGKNSMDGIRKSLAEEFSTIYCFNLRGDQRTAGELSRKEGGKVFGAGSRASVAITLLVKNPEKKGPCQLFYRDIGDYLTQQQKLQIVGDAQSIAGLEWTQITPNEHGDWVDQRDPSFDKFIPLGDKSSKTGKKVFSTYSLGLVTSRDVWAYNFSKEHVLNNMRRMTSFFNSEVKRYAKLNKGRSKKEMESVDAVIDRDPLKISWSRGLKAEVGKMREHTFDPGKLRTAMYRPFCKQWVYFDKTMNEMVLLMPKLFPKEGTKNLAISIVGPGARQDFAALMTDTLPDLHLSPDGAQCFPLYYYEENESKNADMFDGEDDGLTRRDAIGDETLKDFQTHYGGKVTKEDIFFYVYGVLHSPEYKQRFQTDLKKVLPRLPFARDFWAFSKAGRKLSDLHVGYEQCEPWPVQETARLLDIDPKKDCRVTKMIFGKGKDKKADKTTIIVNSNITLGGIPLEAYQYVVNGKPAIEWVMERYQVTRDKDSQIANDPNDWSDNPRYVIDLLKKVIRVSVETVKIVNELPPLDEHVEGDNEQSYEVSRSVEKLSKAATEAFYAKLPKWVAAQKASHALKLHIGLKLGQGDKFIEDFAKATPNPIELDDGLLLAKPKDGKSYSVIAVFPSGSSRTIGEVKDGKIDLFGYWALFDPDEEMAEESLGAELALNLNFVVVEVKNVLH
jgi:predicted helicase